VAVCDSFSGGGVTAKYDNNVVADVICGTNNMRILFSVCRTRTMLPRTNEHRPQKQRWSDGNSGSIRGAHQIAHAHAHGLSWELGGEAGKRRVRQRLEEA